MCYLTAVEGQFHGGGEWVQLVDMGSGVWDFRVYAQSTRVAANAGCLEAASDSDYTYEYQWHPGQRGPTVMQPADSYACFLTGIAGHFAGGGEYVTVDRVDGYWRMFGFSYQQGVSGYARCVKTPKTKNVYYFGPANPPRSQSIIEGYGSTFIPGIHPKPFPVCYLTSVSGLLENPNPGGNGIAVSIGFQGNPYYYNWYSVLYTANWVRMGVGCVEP